MEGGDKAFSLFESQIVSVMVGKARASGSTPHQHSFPSLCYRFAPPTQVPREDSDGEPGSGKKLWGGSIVKVGEAECFVTETGLHTMIGEAAKSIQESGGKHTVGICLSNSRLRSPLHQLASTARTVGWIAAVHLHGRVNASPTSLLAH